jgi:Uma2 family endonuclease
MVTLNLNSVIYLSPEQFEKLCHANPEAKLELTATGELVVMSPTGGESGIRNMKRSALLYLWAEKDGTGVSFDSSTMFQLPLGAFRSPDAAWIAKARWQALTNEEKKTFPPICPDFAIELRSPSDSLKELQNKMEEYLDNGVQLGWLIDPQTKQVEIYRASRSKEILQNPDRLDGENVLPGFVLELAGIL